MVSSTADKVDNGRYAACRGNFLIPEALRPEGVVGPAWVDRRPARLHRAACARTNLGLDKVAISGVARGAAADVAAARELVAKHVLPAMRG